METRTSGRKKKAVRSSVKPAAALPDGNRGWQEGDGRGPRGPRTMLFWDYFRFDHFDNVRLRQATPTWRPEANYTDPITDRVGGEVFFDTSAGLWRVFHIGHENQRTRQKVPDGFMGIFLSESPDGIRWAPSPQPSAKPVIGPKVAPHHVGTIPRGAWGSFYVDPLAIDGYRYKLALLEWGDAPARRALRDHSSPWHRAARNHRDFWWQIDQRSFAVSRDGLRWEQRLDYDWRCPGWHPEEPMFAFFNRATGEYCMTPRAGLGDRRQCIIKTRDFRTWTPPRLLMQPDLLDGQVLDLYAMPVSPYAGGYVGLIWACHFSNSIAPHEFNQYFGPTDCQLASSPDGEYWVRPVRDTFIPLNPAPQPGCGMIRPECVIEAEDEVRIYSGSFRQLHGGHKHARPTETPDQVMLLHTLRKDGFMFLESCGGWGELTTKPLILFDGQLTVNANARGGEMVFAFTTWKNQPMPGYSFDDCIPMKLTDSLAQPIRFRHRSDLGELMRKGVRLRMRFQNARIYSLRGDYHFACAHDVRALDHGLSIDTTWFGD
jgi:hypothetical protein